MKVKKKPKQPEQNTELTKDGKGGKLREAKLAEKESLVEPSTGKQTSTAAQAPATTEQICLWLSPKAWLHPSSSGNL